VRAEVGKVKAKVKAKLKVKVREGRVGKVR
jgi:hypothetical protein